MNIRTVLLSIFFIVISPNITEGQYFYEYDNKGKNNIWRLYKTDAYTGERERILAEYVYDWDLFLPNIDDSGNWFFTYKDNSRYNKCYYMMVNLQDPPCYNPEWDGYPGTVVFSRYSGYLTRSRSECPGYYAKYHHATRKLYLSYSILDTVKYPEEELIEVHSVVDPITGKGIKTFEPFFGLSAATFSKDGKKIYAPMIPTEEERSLEKFYSVIIDTQNDSIIEKIPAETIVPESTIYSIKALRESYIEVNYWFSQETYYDEAYTYVYDLEKKKKSKTIRYHDENIDGGGESLMSRDCKYIISAPVDSSEEYNYSGQIWIHRVDWEDDRNILKWEDGIFLQLPPGEDRLVDPFLQVYGDPSVIVYRTKLHSDKYLIRISDGKLLRKNFQLVD